MGNARTRLCAILLAAAAAILSSCGGSADIESDPLHPMARSREDNALGTFGDPVREMRGVYVATVYNLDFPSSAGLDADKLRSELDDIVGDVAALGCNAIFFQVRGACDAMYDSAIFPVSEYLTGKTGAALPDGFDPLSYITEAAHKNGIAVHAWVNPLRVTRGSVSNPKTDTTALAETSPARLHPEYTVEYAGELYFDPGLPEVRALIADGVREIVDGYDVDGIIFDDYFYPYPVDGYEFDDSASYAKYGSGDIGDWRRSNVDEMIRQVWETVKSCSPDCEFGVAPFGIWQNDDGKNGGSATRGLESYSALFCDTLAWIRGGYVDYVAPQIYWSFSKESAPFGVLADWWDSATRGTRVKLYISHAAYKYGTDEWSFAHAVGELTEQIGYSRLLFSYRGSIMYGIDELRRNVDGAGEELARCYGGDVCYFSSSDGNYVYYK